jgi:hypothetical protein
MTTYTWSTGTTGIWSASTNWTPTGVPGMGDDAVIDAAGTYVVTVTTGTPAAANSITLDAASATLTDASLLTLAGSLAVNTGTLVLAAGGTIAGGTIVAGGTVAFNGGELDGVTYAGLLDLLPDGSLLDVAGGLAIEGAGGVGAGTIALTGSGDVLTWRQPGVRHDSPEHHRQQHAAAWQSGDPGTGGPV